MKYIKRESLAIFFFIASAMIIFSVLIMAIRNSFGSVLIHEIITESYDGFDYHAKLYRPLQASSLNPLPAILIFSGASGDRNSLESFAADFARKGIITLCIEDFGKGLTAKEPDSAIENTVDSGFTFLNTRNYVDTEKIGLLSYRTGCKKSLESVSLQNFKAAIWLSPKENMIDTILMSRQGLPNLFFVSPIDEFAPYRFKTIANKQNEQIIDASIHSEIMVISPRIISKASDWLLNAFSTNSSSNSIRSQSPGWLIPIFSSIIFFLSIFFVFSLEISLQKIPLIQYPAQEINNTAEKKNKIWLPLSFSLCFLLFFIQGFFSEYSESILHEPIEIKILSTLQNSLRWIAVTAILFLFLQNTDIFFKNKKVRHPISIYHVLRSFFIVFIPIVFLYFFIKTGESLLRVSPGEPFQLLKTIDKDQRLSFLELLLSSIFLFWSLSRLSMNVSNMKRSFFYTGTFLCGGFLLIILITYIPMIFTHQSGWERLSIAISNSSAAAQDVNFFSFLSNSGWAIITSTSLTLFPIFLLLASLLTLCFSAFHSHLPGAITCGFFLSWVIVSRFSQIIMIE